MTEDTPTYDTQDTENKDQSLFTTALKDSLYFTEDLELFNNNEKPNSKTTNKTPNENSKTTLETAFNNDTDLGDENLKQAYKVRFVRKQPAPSTLKNSLGRIIGKHSNQTPIARRVLFQTTPSTSYNDNNSNLSSRTKRSPRYSPQPKRKRG
jgi:hypothetical protein